KRRDIGDQLAVTARQPPEFYLLFIDVNREPYASKLKDYAVFADNNLAQIIRVNIKHLSAPAVCCIDGFETAAASMNIGKTVPMSKVALRRFDENPTFLGQRYDHRGIGLALTPRDKSFFIISTL